jgi:putative sigma-54 modulation protein
MNLDITGHHIEVTDALRDYVNSKLDRLERHFDNVTNTHVVLTVEKNIQKAEATLHVSGGNLFANAEDENMYAAIDALADKLDRQVLKHKEKMGDHRRSEGRAKSHSYE